MFSDIVKIISANCTYNNINKKKSIKMRNRSIQLLDAFVYRFQYSLLGTTKESIASDLNFINNKNFSRQAYDGKEKNIPSTVYLKIYNDLCAYYNTNFGVTDQLKVIGVDGTYNRDSNYNEMLNMGIFDISNSIPISLDSYGNGGKNNEVKLLKKIILDDPSKFDASIIVADRAYYCYDLIKFLVNSNIKFVIRVKRNGNNLTNPNRVPKSDKNYYDIHYLKDKVRIIKNESIYDKTVYVRDPKLNHKRKIKNVKQHILTVKNDYVLITNLLDDETYSDSYCLNVYKSRWDIEVFFKLIKETYKFSSLKESNIIANLKSYYCILSLEILAKLIVKIYSVNQQIKESDCKYNHSNLMKGLKDKFLTDLIYGKVNENTFLRFCKAYIKFNKIKKDRNYPRISKSPFSKWYIKKYSNMTTDKKIIDAIRTNKLATLNKNLKTRASKILKIDGVNCKKYLT